MKTFMVCGAEGAKLEAEQLATFVFYIQNIQYRFVVTKLPGDVASVTHRGSGKRVCQIPYMTVISALSDYAAAGKSALQELIKKHGEARVASVLRTAEA